MQMLTLSQPLVAPAAISVLAGAAPTSANPSGPFAAVLEQALTDATGAEGGEGSAADEEVDAGQEVDAGASETGGSEVQHPLHRDFVPVLVQHPGLAPEHEEVRDSQPGVTVEEGDRARPSPMSGGSGDVPTNAPIAAFLEEFPADQPPAAGGSLASTGQEFRDGDGNTRLPAASSEGNEKGQRGAISAADRSGRAMNGSSVVPAASPLMSGARIPDAQSLAATWQDNAGQLASPEVVSPATTMADGTTKASAAEAVSTPVSPASTAAVHPGTAVPVAASTPTAAPNPAPAARAPETPVPLPGQISSALAHLRTASTGEHVLVVRVHPDEFGPVRVTALIGTDGVRMELAAASDHAREALRGALGDLRRELAATGLQAEVSVSSSARDDKNPGFGLGGSSRESRSDEGQSSEGSIVRDSGSAPPTTHREAAVASRSLTSATHLDLFI